MSDIKRNITTTLETTGNEIIVDLHALQVDATRKDKKAVLLRLQSLTEACDKFETTVYRTANEHLYRLLQQCYALFYQLTKATEDARTLRAALESYRSANKNRVKFSDNAHTLAKIVHYAFAGVNAKRLSTYSTALLVVHAEALKPDQVFEFLSNTKGGIETLRRKASPTAVSDKQKADQAANMVQQSQLATITEAKIGEKLDPGNADQQVLLLATQHADGSVTVHDVILNKGIVNAALVAFYGKHKQQLENSAVEQSVQAQAAQLDAAREAAALSISAA